MMAEYVVKLEGTEEMIANLKSIDRRIRDKASLDAVEAGAFQIGNKARLNAPIKTGALKNSAGVNPRVKDSDTKVITRMGENGAEAEIGFRGLAYARIQEFGGMAGRNHSVKITGKHYLGNAIEETKGLVVDAMSDAIRPYLTGK